MPLLIRPLLLLIVITCTACGGSSGSGGAASTSSSSSSSAGSSNSSSSSSSSSNSSSSGSSASSSSNSSSSSSSGLVPFCDENNSTEIPGPPAIEAVSTRDQNAGAYVIDIDGWKFSYYGRQDIDIADPGYSKAVIVLHGTNRNADDYYDRAESAAITQGVDANTLIIAPHFKIDEDMPIEDELYWTSAGWKIGFKSVNGSRLSSFAVVDNMIDRILANYTNVKHVTVVGHSAGGQFVQRYAGISEKENSLAENIHIRYVVANPSSYAYLNDQRPYPVGSCAGFNRYKYSFVDADKALAYTTLSLEEIQTQLLEREVVVLLGTADNDPNSSSLDKTCESMTQGQQRFERGHNYLEHILSVDPMANHRLIEVEGVGHSSTGMFNSVPGQLELFLFDIDYQLARADQIFDKTEQEYPNALINSGETLALEVDNRIAFCRRYEDTDSGLHLWFDNLELWLKLDGMEWFELD